VKRNLAVVILAVLVLFMYLGEVLLFWPFTFEDAFISFRYAENFGRGSGLVFNKGEYVEGYTNFLWTFILGFGSKLRLDVLRLSKWMGFTLSLATLGLTYVVAIEFVEERVFGLLAVLLVGTVPYFAIWAVTGLETAMYTFFLVLTVYLVLLEVRYSTVFPLGVLGLVPLALTRPDGLMFGGLYVLWKLMLRFRKGRVSWQTDLLLTLGLLGLGFLPYYVWRTIYYSDWLPNTFYAKAGGDLLNKVVRGIERLQDFFMSWRVLEVALAVMGTLFTRRRLGQLFLVLAVVFQLLFVVWSGGAVDVVSNYRFVVPVLPLIAVLTVRGVEVVAIGMPALPGASSAKWCSLVAVCCVVGSLGFNVLETREEWLNWRALMGGALRPRIKLAHSLARLPEEWKVSYTDMGSFAYYCGLTMIDGLGLVDRYVAHRMYQGGENVVSTWHTTETQKDISQYILKQRPEFVILVGYSRDASRAVTGRDLQFGHMKAMVQSTDFENYAYWQTVSSFLPARLSSKGLYPEGRHLYVYVREDVLAEYERLQHVDRESLEL